MEEWFDAPEGQVRLPVVLTDLSLDGVTASLRYEKDDLWFCIRAEGESRAEPLGTTDLVIGRTVRRGPFFLTGSFEGFPHDVRRIRLTNERGDLDVATTDQGWLCLVSGAMPEPVRVSWLDSDGEERQAVTSPPLDEGGTLGPTNYVPLR